ncbi:MAG: carboxypeptidase-like regulatory domain-containing protein, partial [Calditrichaeota bacterium]
MIKRTLLLLSLLFLFITGETFSGTTGKIAGQVLDASTKEPLPGVNLVVAGTLLGAATDLEGRYTILQVPPGSHELQAASIGFTRVVMRDVVVRIDQTTRIDFALTMQAIEGEEIFV